MSEQDIQLIRKAVENRWLFWLYFWRIPRYLKAMADEMDRVWAEEAKFLSEKSGIEQARDEAMKANKNVLRWVHVTHRLSTTPEGIRALFAAGKRLSVLLLFLSVAMPLNAQLPPILRQYFTTNAHVLSSGAGVLTNNGVGTPGTLGWLSLSSLASASSVIWTNDGGVIRLTTNAPVNVTNNFSVHADRIILSTNGWIFLYPTGLVNGVDASIIKQMLTNGAFLSWQETPGFTTNCSVFVIDSAPSFGLGDFSDPSESKPNSNCVLNVSRGGFGLVVTSEGVTNLVADSFEAGVLSCFFEGANNVDLNNGGGSFSGMFGGQIDDFRTITSDGVFLGVEAAFAREIDISVADGSASFNRLFNVTNVDVTVDNAALMVGEAIDSTNAWMRATDGSLLAVVLNLATNLGVNVANAQTGSIAVGIVTGAERLSAIGHTTGVGALAVGRDLSSTNNWTFGIHYTNFIPLSLAVGANGTTQFRAASNSVVIRTETAPTVGQILTATDTSGTVGWSNAPSVSLTPWTSDIDAAAFSLTNFGSTLSFTNGSKIGATAINTLSLTNAHLMFSADNTFDIGASGATRPRDIHVGRNLIVNGISTSLQVPNGHVYIGQDQLYYIASRLSIASSGSSGILRVANEGQTSFDRIQFGGTTAAFPGLGRTNGHLVVVDAARANSTNSLFFGNTVDTTASTGMTMNRQTGRVRLSSGSQTYLVTNSLATANSIVTATVNSDDANALSVKAIPAAGLITLKVNAATAADTDISFFISSP